jgi:hypothetical protein
MTEFETADAIVLGKNKLYDKILKAKLMFLNKNIKQTGKSFKHNYFSLSDIIPPTLEICKELNIVPIFKMDKEVATLRIQDLETVNYIEFTSPNIPIDGKNFDDCIKNTGKQETYQRRYLYLQFLDIVEHDYVESEVGKPVKEDKKDVKKNKTVERRYTSPKMPKQEEHIVYENMNKTDLTKKIGKITFDKHGKTEKQELLKEIDLLYSKKRITKEQYDEQIQVIDKYY